MISLRSSTRSFIIAGFLLALFAHGAFAHTYVSSVYLGGVALAEGDCVRPHPSTAFDSPIPLVTQADMTCGWLPEAGRAANRKCPIAAGSTIGIQWHHNSNAASDDIIDPTHKGPVMVYLAKSDTGSGAVWFKIYEDGYTGGRWGVDRLLDNRGRVDVTLPADIAPGNYLLRGEIIALHGAYALNGVQPYVGCVELTVSSSGTANPTGVSLPGAYSPSDPGMLIDIYGAITSYTIPGPAVYRADMSAPISGSSSSSGSGATMAPTKAPTAAPPSSPTAVPTSAPSNPTGGNLKVQMNSGSNTWWFALAVTGGSESTVKVELKDSGAVSTYSILSIASYGFYYSQSIQLTLPISVRLTSSSGKQVVLENVFTAWTSTPSLIDTGKNYGTSSSTSAPTYAPTTTPTRAPTYAPTTTPTTAPTKAPTTSPPGSVKITQHSGSSAWWFAVEVTGASNIAKVELRDSDTVSTFSALTSASWGYYVYETRGAPLQVPLTVKVTSTSGSSVTGTITAISGGATLDTRANL